MAEFNPKGTSVGAKAGSPEGPPMFRTFRLTSTLPDQGRLRFRICIFHNNRFLLAADPELLQNFIVRGFIESPEYRKRFGP